jgi:RNA polymerase sigma factor (sigma-70 family)
MSPLSVYTDVTGQAIAMAAAGEAESQTAEPQINVERVAALFDAHHVRLYRLARRMSGSADQASDLVQETYLRAVRAVGSIPAGESHEAAWLVRVLVNICRDGWRRRASHARLDALAARSSMSSTPPHPEAAFIARTTVCRALESLPPRRRAAIVMYELEGASLPEIASLLGVSVVTVRWHLSRGRRELARVILESQK